MSLPNLGFGSKTNHDQLGGTTYPRYMVMYAERKQTSDSIPNDEDPIFGFRGATTHTTGTDAKVYMGILNGVLPTPKHNITVSNLSAGVVIETDRITTHPGMVLSPTTTIIAPDTKGSLMYDSGSDELKYYDGTWQVLSTGSGMSVHDLTGTWHSEDATGGAGNFLKADSATTFSWQAHGLVASDVGAYTTAQVDSAIDTDIATHAALSDVHHTQNHALIDTTGHTVAGLTIGHFLKADTATTYSFQAHGLSASDVGAYTTAQTDSAIDTDIATHASNTDAHHPKSHDMDSHSDATLIPGSADQMIFWDYSDSQYELLSAGTGLSISVNSLNCNITQYTDTMTENVITAELVNGQSIDNAIDSLISTHAGKPADHHALVTVTADPLTILGQAVTFNYHADYFSIGSANDLKVGTDTPNNTEVLTWSSTLGAVWSPASVTAHDLTSASHTDSGLTIGHFLKATGATTFAWDAHGLSASDVSAEPAGSIATHAAIGGAHHSETHVLATTGPHSGSLPLSDVTISAQGSIITGQSGTGGWAPLVLGTLNHYLACGATEVGWQQIDHSHLTNVTTSQHHVKYADSEAVSAVQAANPLALSHGLTVIGPSVTIGSLSTSVNTNVSILAGDTVEARLSLYGNSQGTGVFFVGQSSTYGGGMLYQGDATPAHAGSGAIDSVSFYRTTVGVHYPVFHYLHNSDNVTFQGDVTVANLVTTGNVDGVDVSAHAANTAAHHALVTVTADPLTLSGQAITFNYGSTHFQIGSGNELLIGKDTPANTEVLTWSSTLGAVWSPNTPAAHDLTSASHTDSGLTIGHFLKATGATTFAWGAHGLGASDVGAYTTAEVDSAIDADILTHKNIVSAHHTQYTNAMAVAAVVAQNPLTLTNDLTITGGNLGIGIAANASYLIESGDGNYLSRLGRTQIGHATYTNYASFCYRGMSGAGQYALIQNSLGLTSLNSASGQPVDFRINHVIEMNLTASGLQMQSAGARIDEFSTDVNLAGNSDVALVTEKAIKTYVDATTGGGPGSGTPWDLPVWDASGNGLGDSMVSQNSAGTAATIGGTTTINTISAGGADYDKFLVSDAGLIKFRTGAEVVSDIGAAATAHTLASHSDVTMTGSELTNITLFSNSAWLNLYYLASSAAEVWDYSSAIMVNPTTTNQWLLWHLPQPTMKGALKLHVNRLRIGLYDADASNYIDAVEVSGVSYTGKTALTVTDKTVNKTTPALVEWVVTNTDCSGYEVMAVEILAYLTNTFSFGISSVALRCYYI